MESMEFPFDIDHGEQNKGYPYPMSLGGTIRTSFSQNKKKKASICFLILSKSA